jgi:chitodextrinase
MYMKHQNIKIKIFLATMTMLSGMFFCAHAQAANWYVDNAASGAKNGTSWTNAWQSFAAITWASIQPGDTLYISGGSTSKTYTETWTVGKSGTAALPITIAVDASNSSHNGTVIFDYNAKGDTATNVGISVNGISYLTINGNVSGDNHIQINNLRNIVSRWQAQGIYGNGCGGLIIDHVTFINDNVPIRLTYPTSAITISNCRMEKVRGDGAVQILGVDTTFSWDTFKIHDSYFELMDNSAIPPGAETDSSGKAWPYAGPDGLQVGSGVSIYNNTFKEVVTTAFYTSNQHPDMLQLVGNYMKVYNNEFINIADSQIDLDSNGFHDVWIYNNIFRIVTAIDPYPQSIRLYASGAPIPAITNIKILNNTFIDNPWQMITFFNYSGNPTGSGNEIKNNIFYNSGPDGYHPAIGIENSTGFDANSFSFDGNIYYNSASTPYITFRGTNYTASNWISAKEPHGKIIAPQFVSYAPNADGNDLHLKSSDTTAKDSGLSLSAYFTADKDGVSRPQGSAWDIGAYEYVVAAGSDTTAPTVPANLASTAISATQINLTWTVSTDNIGVTGYKIYRNGTQVGTSASNSYSDTGLTASTQYSYTIAAYDAAGNASAQGGAVNVITMSASDTQAPTVPTNFAAAVISTTQINLSWTASTDNVAVTGYKIYRNGTQIGISASNSYSSTGLNASTQYSYTVSAYDAAGNASAQCASVSATTQTVSDTQAPTVPSGLTATAIYSSQINLSWNASTDSTGVVGYRVYRNGTQIATSTGTTYSNTGLTASTQYSYTISAYDAARNFSAQSASISATTVSVIPNSTTLSVSVSSGPDDVFEIEGGTYRTDSNILWMGRYGSVDHQIGLRFSNVAIPPNAIINQANLELLGDIDDDNNASSLMIVASVENSAVVWDSGNKPSQRTRTSAGVVWNTMPWIATTYTSPNISSVIQEIVNRSGWSSGNSLAIIIRNNGTTAADADRGFSSYEGGTAPKLIITYTAPSADTQAPIVPTGLTATAISNTQINLSWTASTDNVAVAGYRVYRNGTQIATSTGTTYSNTGLTASTQYSYTVSAYDAARNFSAQGASVSATTRATPDTTPPAGSVSLNSGASYTKNVLTTLTLLATDISGVAQMKLSDISTNFDALTAIAFSSPYSWTLLGVDGVKTVYAWFKDSAGNWMTTPVSDTIILDCQPAQISNITVTNISATSATLSWTTSESTEDYVDYGFTSAYSISTNEEASPVLTHTAIISSLSADSTYNFRIVSSDRAANQSFSTNQTFKTLALSFPDTTAPAKIANLSASNIKTTSADLSWIATGDDNNIGSAKNYIIKYSTTAISISNTQTEIDSWWNNATVISQTLTPKIAGLAETYSVLGLAAQTKYYFAIKAIDEADNPSAISNILTLTTLTAPANSGNSSGGSSGGGGGGGGAAVPVSIEAPANFRAIGAKSQISLQWTNPASTDFVRVKLYRKDNSASTGLTDSQAILIYEGVGKEFSDLNVEAKKTYYYTIYAIDRNLSYSLPKTISVVVDQEKETISIPKVEETKTINTGNTNVSGGSSSGSSKTSLVGVKSAEVETITKAESQTLIKTSKSVSLSAEMLKIYQKIIALAEKPITQSNKYAIAEFIQNGTPTTVIIGAGERGGSIASFRSAFGRLPESETDWQDVVKIANGRWPSQKNITAEQRAQTETFAKIYGRTANLKNQNDNAAVTVITYGLRPAQRNVNSEKAAILSFKYFYKKSPTTAQEWDIVRAIAYSGAKR